MVIQIMKRGTSIYGYQTMKIPITRKTYTPSWSSLFRLHVLIDKDSDYYKNNRGTVEPFISKQELEIQYRFLINADPELFQNEEL